MPLKNYLSRIEKLRSYFKTWKVGACLIENPLDLYYLTGLQLSLGILVILPKEAHLFVDGRYIDFAKKNSPVPVQLLSEKALQSALNKTVGFDSYTTTVNRAAELKKITRDLKPIPHLLQEVRAIKDRLEIQALEKSASLLWKGFLHIQKHLKVGVSEKDIALEFEIFCRQKGAEKLAFSPIIAFGKNSAYPHYRAGDTSLKKGDIVLIDIGVVVDHYHSDMTRTLFFGKADSRLVLLDSVVKKAHAAALKLCKSGSRVGDLDAAARKVIEQAGVSNLILHSLGHGIGLETHEFPRLKYQGENHEVVLKEGMAITIEPGLYMPGVGGIRHEDTIVITSKGYKNFYVFE